MELPPAEKITRDAIRAARNRMIEGIVSVQKQQLTGYTVEAKATLIAGYMTASAGYEIAQYLWELCEGIDGLHAELQSLSNKGE